MLRNKNIKNLNRVTTAHLLQYQHYLYSVRRYKELTVRRFTWAVRRYLMWLYHNGLIHVLPWQGLRYIKPPDSELLWKSRRHYTIEEITNLWRNQLRRDHLALKTIKTKMRHLQILISFLENNNINSIYKVKPCHVEQFKKYLKTIQYQPGCYYGRFVRQQMLFNVSRCFNWLHSRRKLRSNPFAEFKIKTPGEELSDKRGRHKFTKKDISVPDTLLLKYRDYFIARGYRPYMADAYLRNLARFYKYLADRGITDITKVTKRHLMEYHTYLSQSGKYAQGTIANRLIQVRSYFKFLVRYEAINCDPASCIELPKDDTGLPHTCMTEREVNILLSLPDTYDSVGIRDKAILETLYSTGVRSSELCGIETKDIDFSQRLLTVCNPKGGKAYQRVIPIGKAACYWTKRYLSEVRPFFKSDGASWLFLTTRGKKLFRQDISGIVKKYLHKSGLRKTITPHSFRVSCATHMLHNNADIRYVQAQLGHRSIQTTQEYTRLVPTDLKRVHGLCHPREKRIYKARDS